MDQNADGTAGEAGPATSTRSPCRLGGTPFVAPFNQTTLPLIVPGPHVISSAALDASGDVIAQTNGQNLALNTPSPEST